MQARRGGVEGLAVLVIGLLASSMSGEVARERPRSDYPVAVDLEKVGQYSALAKSGGGYFYDEVLEYRVWIDVRDGDDYYFAFPTYEEAERFANVTKGAEPPLVLVRQHEYVNEPEPGKYEHVRRERIAEWRVEWLKGQKREPESIAEFLRQKAAAVAP